MDREYYVNTERYVHKRPPSQTTLERIEIVTEVAKLFDVRIAADFGAGRGDICLAMAKQGIKAYSVDIPGKTSAYAAQRYKEAGFDVTSFSPEAFFGLSEEVLDMILSFDVLEHLHNPFRFIHRSWEKLKPEGLLLLSADLHNFGDEAHIPDHFIYEPFLIQLIENVGFKHLDSAIQWRPHLRRKTFTFGSIRVDCFQKIMAGSSIMDRYKLMAKKYSLR